MNSEADRIFLKTKTPIYVVWRTFLVTIIMIGMFVFYPIFKTGFVFDRRAIPFFLIMSFLTYGPHIFQSFMAKGYRLSYDSRAIHLRRDGVANWKFERRTERTVLYDDIDLIVGEGPPIESLGVTPFEFVRVYSKNEGDAVPFIITTVFLTPADMKEFIWHLYRKRPDAFAQNVIDYLNKD